MEENLAMQENIETSSKKVTNFLKRYAINITISIIAITYIVSMVVIPIYSIEGNIFTKWHYLQSVSSHWQSLNVGILAFISAMIALSRTQYSEQQKQKSRLHATRSILQITLSNLSNYCEESIEHLKTCREYIKLHDSNEKTKIPSKSLPIPIDDIEALKDCLLYFEHRDAIQITTLIMQIQIQNSKMKQLIKELNNPTKDGVIKLFSIDNVDTPLRSTINLQAMVNETFDFARFLSNNISAYKQRSTIKNIMIQHFSDIKKYKDLYIKLNL